MKRLIAFLVCLIFALGTTAAMAGAPSAPPGKKKKKKQQEAEANRDPLYSLTLMRQGTVFMQQGRFEAALESFTEADRIAPGNATVQNMTGLCHMRLGQFDQALAAFDRALRIVPGFTDARNNRGASYLSIGQYHLAEVDFLAVLSDSTYQHRKQVNYNLGMTYLQRNELGAAAENFRKAVVLPNPVFEAYLRLAEISQRNGELESSLDLLEEARMNFPERTEASLEIGKVLLLMGRDQDAVEYLQRVIDAAPGSTSADMARSLLGSI
jgi:tetratricopeptide (TPR) repeat protein